MPRVTNITVARLYNLGSYEHLRYEVSAQIDPGESAQDVLIGLEKIMEALKPERACCVETHTALHHAQLNLDRLRDELRSLTEDEFRRRNGHFEGTPEEYVARCALMLQEQRDRRAKYEARAAKARALLDSLGGSSQWKDCKLDWENDDDL